MTEISLGKVDGTSVESLAVSPDSRRVAFAVKRGEKTVLVVDGKEKEGTYDKIAGIAFSPDS
ncbi:MAG: hypothetical protein ABIH04_04935, partial [Planctomycetota bacterium]